VKAFFAVGGFIQTHSLFLRIHSSSSSNQADNLEDDGSGDCGENHSDHYTLKLDEELTCVSIEKTCA